MNCSIGKVSLKICKSFGELEQYKNPFQEREGRKPQPKGILKTSQNDMERSRP